MSQLQKPLCKILTFILLPLPLGNFAQQIKTEDLILGNWITVEKNLIVNISKDRGNFKANIIWFNDSDNPLKPMNIRTDSNNPDQTKRQTKLIGLSILNQLIFNPKSERWEAGVIYDPISGKYWSAIVNFTDNGLLRVKGYWQFEFLSRSLYFKRAKIQ